MQENVHSFAPTPDQIEDAKISALKYLAWHEESLNDPAAFWAKRAHEYVTWEEPFTKVKETSFHLENHHIRWFEDGRLNVSVNCLDRHLETRGDKTAIIWEGDTPGHTRLVTYRELHEEVCRCANVLKGLGLTRGERVTIYLPMIVEAAVFMLACTRLGLVHSVVFGGFSAEALAGRIEDCESRVVITADEGRRGGKTVPLKANVDGAIALLDTPIVEKVIVVANTGADVPLVEGRDLAYGLLRDAASTTCAPESMNAEDPLFILYTSGSTGKPKGMLHTTGGYLVYAAMTHDLIFDVREDDIYWCTADVGWVTGHSYVLYGPLCNGATTLMFEGVPSYPDFSRFWQVIDQHQVTTFYTAPTAIRALMREGDAYVTRTKRTSLRILGSVGEPINSEAWLWYHNVVGRGKCQIMDTWWQTETGGILITPLPGCLPLKPGCATRPFFGVQPAILHQNGREVIGVGEGSLVITDSWPGQARTIYKDHERFLKTYFHPFPGFYTSGDGAHRDHDGDIWITGRMDDVINVSGHRLSTAEIETALGTHHAVAESAVVGVPHDIKGQGVYAFVTLAEGQTPSPALAKELEAAVREKIGAFAKPDYIQWAGGLPKTRSGKIMRRILRKIASGESEHLGDISTLADPGVVAVLIEGQKQIIPHGV
ncbi:MAG: acetate--CoA ligase [Candidatus Puniceispirillum sp.]|nr:acetate--CoA ligase [Candidatus Puniceispirillum sp.]